MLDLNYILSRTNTLHDKNKWERKTDLSNFNFCKNVNVNVTLLCGNIELKQRERFYKGH